MHAILTRLQSTLDVEFFLGDTNIARGSRPKVISILAFRVPMQVKEHLRLQAAVAPEGLASYLLRLDLAASKNLDCATLMQQAVCSSSGHQLGWTMEVVGPGGARNHSNDVTASAAANGGGGGGDGFQASAAAGACMPIGKSLQPGDQSQLLLLLRPPVHNAPEETESDGSASSKRHIQTTASASPLFPLLSYFNKPQETAGQVNCSPLAAGSSSDVPLTSGSASASGPTGADGSRQPPDLDPLVEVMLMWQCGAAAGAEYLHNCCRVQKQHPVRLRLQVRL